MIEAAGNNDQRTVTSFLDLGCDIAATSSKFSTDDEGAFTALHLAAMVAFLLSRNAPLESRSCKTAPLHLAASHGHAQVVRALVDANASFDSKDTFGSTPLHCAAMDGRDEIVELLLSLNAPVDPLDDQQDTPLHGAALKGHASIVRILLAANADPNAVDAEGQMPIDWAELKGHKDVIALLS